MRNEKLVDITYEALLELIKTKVKLPSDAQIKCAHIDYGKDIVSIKITSSAYPEVPEGSDEIRYVMDGRLKTDFNIRR